jgi:hypothetical protein
MNAQEIERLQSIAVTLRQEAKSWADGWCDQDGSWDDSGEGRHFHAHHIRLLGHAEFLDGLVRRFGRRWCDYQI